VHSIDATDDKLLTNSYRRAAYEDFKGDMTPRLEYENKGEMYE